MRILGSPEIFLFVLKEFLKKKFELLTGSKLYRNSLPPGTCLTHDIKRLSYSPIREVWDVGAHQGETALTFAQSFPQSTIRSFEPVTQNYQLLEKNCSGLKNFCAYQFAFGERNKSAKIHLQDASVTHSLRDDLNQPNQQDLDSEDIEVRTIDSVVSDFSCPSIDLLKIDVEGYELKLLEGSQKCLRDKRINFIFIETGLDKRFNSIESLVNFLSPYGYLPYAFYEQTPHWTGRQNLWYWNTLFARESLL